MNRALPRLPLLTLPLLLLAACSGGGADGDSLEDRRAAYVEQAEDVCRESNERVEALGTPTSVDAVPAAADEAVSIVRDTIEQIDALTPPQEDRAQLQERVLGPLQEDVAVAEAYAGQVRAAAEANDVAALLRLLQERPQTTADLAYMRDYGFAECVAAADQQD